MYKSLKILTLSGCLLIGSYSCSFSQNYFNKHFKIGVSSLTANDLLDMDSYLIGSFLNSDFNGDLMSGVVIISLPDFELDTIFFPGFRNGYNGIVKIQDTLLLYGKNDSFDNNLKIIKYNLDQQSVIKEQPFTSNLDSSFPYSSASIDSFTYFGYIDDSNSDSHREFGILKTDNCGILQWQRNFNLHISRSHLESIVSIPNGNILISSRIWRDGEFLRLPQILSINPEGDLIDSIVGLVETHESQTDVPIVILNNGFIAQVYESLEWDNSIPIRMDFYNSDLVLYNTKFIQNSNTHRFFVRRLVPGKGDYFFIIGAFTDFETNTQFGYITKVSNQGDIIWQHRYQHPDYMDSDIFYSIVDLSERENGDLICMGNIFPIVSQQELWLFKVNEHGCFHGDDCDDEVIYTNTADHNLIERLTISSNPVQNTIHLSSDLNIQHYSISSLSGTVIQKQSYKSSIDVSALLPGLYFITVWDDQGNSTTERFVKVD